MRPDPHGIRKLRFFDATLVRGGGKVWRFQLVSIRSAARFNVTRQRNWLRDNYAQPQQKTAEHADV
jgi:hypothetical protein